MGQEWGRPGRGDRKKYEADIELRGTWPRARYLIVYTVRLWLAAPGSWKRMLAHHQEINDCAKRGCDGVSHQAAQMSTPRGIAYSTRACWRWVNA